MAVPQGKMAVEHKGSGDGCNRPGAWPTIEESTMEDVTWLPIPGASSYEASSDGRIRSVDRYVRAGTGYFWRKGIVLSQHQYSKYGHVNARMTPDDGRARNIAVHVSVCRAFHGEKPTPLHEVRHLNGDPLDNRPENLRWGTRKENAADMRAHGTHHERKKTHCKHGHGFTPENTSMAGNKRVCKACMRVAAKRFRAENPEKVAAWNRRKYQRRKAAEAQGVYGTDRRFQL